MTDEYEHDYYQWTQTTAIAIKEGRFDKVDLGALADEVQSLGKRDRREIISRLAVIALHMLKQEFQPDKSSRSWQRPIAEQRTRLTLILNDSPSLRANVADLLEDAYTIALVKAPAETRLPPGIFPATCPWPVHTVLGEDLELQCSLIE